MHFLVYLFVLFAFSGGAALAQHERRTHLAVAPVTECDTYAANPFDPGRNTEGVALEKIKPDLAVPACESAVQKNRTTFG